MSWDVTAAVGPTAAAPCTVNCPQTLRVKCSDHLLDLNRFMYTILRTVAVLHEPATSSSNITTPTPELQASPY